MRVSDQTGVRLKLLKHETFKPIWAGERACPSTQRSIPVPALTTVEGSHILGEYSCKLSVFNSFFSRQNNVFPRQRLL